MTESETHFGLLTVPIGSTGRNGEVKTVNAEFSDDDLFAVHLSADKEYLFTVTHVPTLRAMTRIQKTRADAWAVVERLRGLGWNWTFEEVKYFMGKMQKLGPKDQAWLKEISQ